jgi:hypothetical protein
VKAKLVGKFNKDNRISKEYIQKLAELGNSNAESFIQVAIERRLLESIAYTATGTPTEYRLRTSLEDFI